MFSLAIVVDFDVVEKSLFCLGNILKFTMMNHLRFYRVEKRSLKKIPSFFLSSDLFLLRAVFGLSGIRWCPAVLCVSSIDTSVQREGILHGI